MIEEVLMQYGILGLWTLTLLAEKYKFNKEMKEIISKNTNAIRQLSAVYRR